MQSTKGKTDEIRRLNDELRRHGIGGRIMVTQGLSGLGSEMTRKALTAVAAFDNFSPDNDPYGERDFGAFEIDGQKFFWKIDYYDKALAAGSPDPSNATVTARVLTVMLAEEY